MSNYAMRSPRGFVCPVRGCSKKNNRLFTPLGMAQHFICKHKEYFIKKLNLKIRERLGPGA